MSQPRFVLDHHFGQFVTDTRTGLQYRAGKRGLIKLLNEVAADPGFVSGSDAVQELPDNPFQGESKSPPRSALFFRADDLPGGVRVTTMSAGDGFETTAEVGAVTILASSGRDTAAYEVHEGLRRCLTSPMPLLLRVLLWLCRRAVRRRDASQARHGRNVGRCVQACERAVLRWIDLHTLQASHRQAVIDQKGGSK